MRGGARPGAGRKPKTELESARQAICESISPRDWHALIRKLYQDALDGNARAVSQLFRYVFYNTVRIESRAAKHRTVAVANASTLSAGAGSVKAKPLATADRARRADREQSDRINSANETDFVEK